MVKKFFCILIGLCLALSIGACGPKQQILLSVELNTRTNSAILEFSTNYEINTLEQKIGILVSLPTNIYCENDDFHHYWYKSDYFDLFDNTGIWETSKKIHLTLNQIDYNRTYYICIATSITQVNDIRPGKEEQYYAISNDGKILYETAIQFSNSI